MNVIERVLAVLLLVVFAPVRAGGAAEALTPGQQIQQTIKRVAAITAESGSDEVSRRDALRRLLLPRFDWGEMAKRALGKHWPAVPDRQAEFVALFTQLLGNTYVGNIGSYKNERVVYLGERRDQEVAQVNTRLEPEKGEPILINYRLHRVHDDWKIYDVVIADISLVNNYRSQFSRVLGKSSFDELVGMLKEKIASQ